jgi:hypothetical protein
MSRIAHWNFDYNGKITPAANTKPCEKLIKSWSYCMGW